MKINGNSIRPGNILLHEGKLWSVLKTQHTQPGKGGAYMQVEMKEVKQGTKTNIRFRASETVELARVEERSYQYLYEDGEMLAFMNNDDYEQISIPGELLGENLVYLAEGMHCQLKMYEGAVIGVSIPEQVVLEVVEAEPVVKGQTAASSYKPAVLENGVRTQVPPFIETGTRIVVNTADGSYVERAKDAG